MFAAKERGATADKLSYDPTAPGALQPFRDPAPVDLQGPDGASISLRYTSERVAYAWAQTARHGSGRSTVDRSTTRSRSPTEAAVPRRPARPIDADHRRRHGRADQAQRLDRRGARPARGSLDRLRRRLGLRRRTGHQRSLVEAVAERSHPVPRPDRHGDRVPTRPDSSRCCRLATTSRSPPRPRRRIGSRSSATGSRETRREGWWSRSASPGRWHSCSSSSSSPAADQRQRRRPRRAAHRQPIVQRRGFDRAEPLGGVGRAIGVVGRTIRQCISVRTRPLTKPGRDVKRADHGPPPRHRRGQRSAEPSDRHDHGRLDRPDREDRVVPVRPA